MSDLLVPLFRFPCSLRRVVFGLVLGCCLLLPVLGRGQVLDDSTKVLYGAKTTRVLREADILREQYEGRIIDTTLTNQMQARYWFHDSTFQQDLGNIGTASRRLLWEPNVELGTRFGRNAFDKYVRNSATIPYYDTRSPYTFFRFIQSGAGEQVFELSYTRSLGKNLNVGLAYERFASNKALQSASEREGQAEHSNVLLFARYQTKDDRYHALFNISTARHRVAEQGGIRYQPADRQADGTFNPRSLFDYALERVNLTRALNVDDRDEVRLVHTYRLLGKGLTAYHIFDWKRQFNKYSDEQLVTDPLTQRLQFYPDTLLSASLTNDRAEYQQVENTVGLMGHTPAVEYRLYGRYRDSELRAKSFLGTTNTVSPTYSMQYSNVYLGGTAGFRYRKLIAIEAAGEVLALQTGPETKELSEFWGRVSARLGPVSGEYLITSYSPTLTQQRFEGNHYAWNHSGGEGASGPPEFRNTLVNQITGRVAQKLGRHYVDASVSGVTINDLVYYSQDSVATARGYREAFRRDGIPLQLNEAKLLLIGSLRHRFNLGKFFFDNQATATSGGSGEGLRIPGLVANGKVYYQNYLFKKALFGQIGAEVYYQSRFKGYGYSPSNQQFYVQDRFTSRNFAVADVFLITDIKTVSVFLKVAYVNQGFYSFGNGYFPTPFYTGLPRRFQFGIRWQFFD
ncbi:putative porin [Hymenobacter sp. BT635]|uniref:Porin n=1 Tax=Hymenobacter nitidus TaxID=2880929 RepID=A0ABS8A9U5_9BACT|nr:putative porin [Hymenobacter nitidus]MCB2377168.1 putative porin [Hymenobacter nitidus]